MITAATQHDPCQAGDCFLALVFFAAFCATRESQYLPGLLECEIYSQSSRFARERCMKFGLDRWVHSKTLGDSSKSAKWPGSCSGLSTMPVSALVLTVDASLDDVLRERLLEDTRVSTGEKMGQFLPIVTDTESVREARDLAEAILAYPGVLDAQLVSWTDEAACEEGK